MIEEVISTALKPLTKEEAWYGIWFAIALRKILMRTIRRAFDGLIKRYFDNQEDKDSS